MVAVTIGAIIIGIVKIVLHTFEILLLYPDVRSSANAIPSITFKATAEMVKLKVHNAESKTAC